MYFCIAGQKKSTATAPLPRRIFKETTAAAPHRDGNLTKPTATAPPPPWRQRRGRGGGSGRTAMDISVLYIMKSDQKQFIFLTSFNFIITI
jgi:hypothetical protein